MMKSLFSVNRPLSGQISYHALNGESVPKTLHFQGSVQHSSVSILVDSGSTHNFIQTRVAKHLGLPVHHAPQFSVMIGNEDKLQCDGICKDILVHIQGVCFMASFHVLPIQGAELVLGVQWLQDLGPVTINYQALTMQFMHLGQYVTLHGTHSSSLDHSSHHQLRRLITTNSVATCFQLLAQSDVSSKEFTNNPLITSVLGKFPHIFEITSSLPPLRDIQHPIVLQKDVSTINVKPYRYPHF